MTCSIPRRGYAVPILRRVSSERFALSASVVSDHTEEAFTNCYELNSTRLNRESRTQVSSTSISASLIHTIINKQYHFMTSYDRFLTASAYGRGSVVRIRGLMRTQHFTIHTTLAPISAIVLFSIVKLLFVLILFFLETSKCQCC